MKKALIAITVAGLALTAFNSPAHSQSVSWEDQAPEKQRLLLLTLGTTALGQLCDYFVPYDYASVANAARTAYPVQAGGVVDYAVGQYIDAPKSTCESGRGMLILLNEFAQ